MSVVVSMVKKDLLRRWRSPLGLAVLLSFPLVFSLLLALAFGGGGEPTIPKIKLLLDDRDDTFVSGLVAAAFSSDQAGEYFDVVQVTSDEGDRLIGAGKASALLRIPAGFGEDLFTGRPVVLELVRNPAEAILPEAAEQSATVLADVLSAGARILRQPLSDIAELSGQDEVPPDAAVADIAVAVNRFVRSSENYLVPPVIELETATVSSEEGPAKRSGRSSIFLLVLPGISVFALFALGDRSMRDLLTESGGGTLRRQLGGPVSAGTVLVAKVLYTAAVSLVSLLMLSTVGVVVSGGEVDLFGFALLSATLILAVTGFSAAVYGLAKNERQGSTLAGVLTLIMGMVGGSFVPLSSLPETLQKIAPFSLFYWGTDGYIKLLMEEGAGVASVLAHSGVLAVGGLVLLAVGSRLLARRIRRGLAA